MSDQEPHRNADISADAALTAGVRRAIAEMPVPDRERGWARLEASIRAEGGTRAVATGPAANDNRVRTWRLAAAVLALVVLGQGAFIATRPDDAARLASVDTARTVADRAELVVAFRPSATEEELRTVLRETEATVVDGPSALGLYRLTVPRSRLEGSEAGLVASNVVESVTRP